MRIAITGSSGRVGRGVVQAALDQGHTVVGVDRVPRLENQAGIDFVQTEMSDYDALLRAFRGCDALIHLAAIPGPFSHPDHVVHNNNVVGSYNALRAAIEAGMTRLCQASSVNATGCSYSRWPRYDYFPLDELHPTYNEEPYGLSKWICELQAESLARRYDVSISSLRFHWVVPERSVAVPKDDDLGGTAAKHLWAYTRLDAAARACLLSITVDFKGAEAFYIVAPETAVKRPSLDLARQYHPNAAIRGDMSGFNGFYNCAKAERLLGWKHTLP